MNYSADINVATKRSFRDSARNRILSRSGHIVCPNNKIEESYGEEIHFYINYNLPIPVTARSKAWVCGCTLA
jgi:hypothetical protein